MLAIVASILGGYLLQALSGDPGRAMERLGFAPAELARGRWSGLVTALFVHGSWAHAVLNALGALAFGAPVARLFGGRARGVTAFFLFYLGCGALGSLGYALVRHGDREVLVGASGAVSGLMGAASRLLFVEGRGAGEGRLAPFTSSPVVGTAVGWIVVNLLLAVFGFSAAAGGAPIAWQAHLFGYAAGLLAVGPTARALRRT